MNQKNVIAKKKKKSLSGEDMYLIISWTRHRYLLISPVLNTDQFHNK